MSTLAVMPRPRKNPTVTVRIATALHKQLSRIAGHRGLSVPDYLALILPPILAKHDAEMIADIQRKDAEAQADKHQGNSRQHGRS